MSKTRKQRKRERLEHLAASLVVVALFFGACLLLCGMACHTWATHPAEQPITYQEHLAQFGGGK